MIDVQMLKNVITIDGPTASGKGTVAQEVAKRFKFHYLDSGALYRLVALASVEKNIASADGMGLAKLVENLDICFAQNEAWLNKQPVTQQIRTETIGNLASVIALNAELRSALIEKQRAFLQEPGLVADGRDMGTVIFPDALLKIFLSASIQVRAQRRYQQLNENGISASMSSLLQTIEARDIRDMSRKNAPLKPAEDSYVIDSSDLSVEQVVEQICVQYAQRTGFSNLYTIGIKNYS